MKRLGLICLLTGIALSCPQKGFSQDIAVMSKPLLLDKEVLSGVGLGKVELKNEPGRDFFQKRLYRGEDLSVYVVSSQSWQSQFESFWFDEFIYLFNGSADITPKGEAKQRFNNGDFFFAPKGFTGSWEILAGDHYHYELSVITTKRADSSMRSTEIKPRLLRGFQISGSMITFKENGLFEKELTKGPELSILLKAEKPREAKINNAKEQLIYLLSGQLQLTAMGGSEQKFFTGDFFVLPKGFTGIWQSKGHGIIKMLAVQKTG